MPADLLSEFLRHAADALAGGAFHRLVLGKPRSGSDLLRVEIARVATGQGERLQAHLRFRQRDETKPLAPGDLADFAGRLLGPALGSAHLFTAAAVWQFELNKKGEPRLTRGRAQPAPELAAPAPHDRPKERAIAPADAPWLQSLGVVGADGRVRAEMMGKFRQINRYVELLLPLVREAGLADAERLRVYDMGAGKGYLTFAAWQALTRNLGRSVSLAGIEARPALVDLGNRIAAAHGCAGLEFHRGQIIDTAIPAAEILIALHACDTATDEAIFQGIRAGAALIVCAPCCHKELRPQLTPPPALAAVGRHGIFAERLAEMVTDSLRALLLEAHGYRVKVFEFVSTEHTAKNTMLAATRHAGATAETKARAARAADDLRAQFGIGHQHLATLLARP